MWVTEHSIETSAAPEAIWRCWAEVERWPEWNANVEHSELRGPFAPGSTIVMTPRNQEPIEMRIAELAEGVSFADEADVDGTTVRIIHRIDLLSDGRAAAVLRLEAEGESAEQLGRAISSDFPPALEALAQHLSA